LEQEETIIFPNSSERELDPTHDQNQPSPSCIQEALQKGSD